MEIDVVSMWVLEDPRSEVDSNFVSDDRFLRLPAFHLLSFLLSKSDTGRDATPFESKVYDGYLNFHTN